MSNLSWGMQFRTCGKIWESADLSLALSQIFPQIQKPHRHYFDGCFELSLSQILADCDCANANQLQISTNLKNNSSLRDSALCAESWQSTFKNAESSADSAESQNLGANQAKIAESTNKTQQTIEAIAVEVVGFLDDFRGNFVLGDKARLKSVQCPKSSKSPQDAPKSKLQQDILQKAIVRDSKY